jgi:dGTPase
MLEWKKLLNPDRPRTSTSSGDHREQFERDFDRSIFSAPVKRLQDKTQVFPLESHDAVRTRLTHSLEVSSVARGLARLVGSRLSKNQEILPTMERQIEAIAATCGLIHDLGNPPFGHAGEQAIREWFDTRFPVDVKRKRDPLSDLLNDKQQLVQDFRNFEGNAQTLRIVSKLQILADPHGLNLTFGTLSAACKYILPSHLADKRKGHSGSKPGYFASENNLIKIIRKQTGTGQSRNPITFLVEAADDIVYSVADIEDGIKKAVIRWSDLEEILRAKLGKRADVVLELKDTILKAGGTELSTHLPDDIHGTAFRSAAIALLVPDAAKTFLKKYPAIMNGRYRGELVEEGELTDLIKCLQEIGQEKVYCTPSTLKLELMGRRIICDLMDLFWEGAKNISVDGTFGTKKFSGKIAALISDNYRRVFANSVTDMPEIPEQYHRLQLVTDYVCGMTDSFAKQLHLELTNG